MSDLITVNPDALAEATVAPADGLVPIWSPAGPLKKLPLDKLLAKLIKTDLVKASKALLDADLAHDADSVAIVINDPTALNNGWYRKTGASGAGAWAQFEVLAKAALAQMQTDLATAQGQVNQVNTALLTLESTISIGAMALSIALHNHSEAVVLKQRLAAVARGATAAVALAARIRNSGWVLEIDVAAANSGGTFNPASIVLISYDKGFDANCQNVIRARVISATKAMRKPYPNQASGYETIAGGIDTWRLSLDQQMFARAKPNTPGVTVNSGFAPILRLEAGWYTVGGNPAPVQDGIVVTNNSTEAYPTVAIRNALVPWRLLGATGKFEVTGNSIEATEGRTFAAARCDLTGQTSGVLRSQIVTSMIASDAYAKRTCAVPVYQANIDMTPFTQGERVIERWRAYPWIGDTPTDSATGTLANGDFANHEHICNRTGAFPKVYAVVNPATGNDTTGVASTVSEAAAAAAPFATDKGAVYAAWLLNQSAHGRNSQSGIEICFSDTTHVLKLKPTEFSSGSLATFDAAEVPVDGTWCVYRPVTGAANCRLQRDTGGSRALPRRTVLRDFAALDTASVTSGTPIFLDLAETTTGTYGQAVWVDNSPILENDGTASTVIAFYRNGLGYMTNTELGNLGAYTLQFGNERHGWMLWRDSNVAALKARFDCPAVLGSTFDVSSGGQFVECPAANTNTVIAHSNIVVAGVMVKSNSATQQPLAYGSNRSTSNFAAINLLVEYFGNGGQGAWGLSGDGKNLNTSNFFSDYVSLVGGRINPGYEDTFTMTDSGDGEEQLKKMLILRRSIAMEINTKTDLHQNVGARIHTWNVAHRVGWKYVRVLQWSSDNSYTAGTGNWFGEAVPASVIHIGPDARAQFTDWKAWHRAPAVVGTGGGNYMPVAGSVLLGVIPANDEACPIDIFGTARAGAVGAIEHVA